MEGVSGAHDAPCCNRVADIGAPPKAEMAGARIAAYDSRGHVGARGGAPLRARQEWREREGRKASHPRGNLTGRYLGALLATTTRRKPPRSRTLPAREWTHRRQPVATTCSRTDPARGRSLNACSLLSPGC